LWNLKYQYGGGASYFLAVGEMALKHLKKSSHPMFFHKFIVLDIASYRSGCPLIITKCKTFFKMK
jgi:hypothetical protein